MADSRGLLQFLKFTLTGYFRAIMRDRAAAPGAPDYTGYGIDVSGEPRAIAVWVEKKPTKFPALKIQVERLKAPDGGKVFSCDIAYRGDVLVGVTDKEWIVGVHGTRNCPTCGADLWRELTIASAHQQSGEPDNRTGVGVIDMTSRDGTKPTPSNKEA